MSLAPREQHLLARIEHSLRCTDPRLARMLATFRLPAFRGGLAHLCRSRGRDFVPPALALVAISLIICCGLLLGHTSSLRCSYRGIPLRPVNVCRTTGQAKKSGHSTSSPLTSRGPATSRLGGRGAMSSSTRLPGGA
jgi:hypothetical protein